MNDCHYNGDVTESDFDSIENDEAIQLVLGVFPLMVTGNCQIYREQLVVLVVLESVEAAQCISHELMKRPSVESRLLVDEPYLEALQCQVFERTDYSVPFQSLRPSQMHFVSECFWMLLQRQWPKR